jgi:uncharacterized protein HemY
MADSGGLYALVGGLAVALAGAGLYIAQQHGAFDSRTIAAVTAPATVPVPAPLPATVPPTADTTPLQRLVADARRAITRGDFAAADRALDQAQALDPHSPDVTAARGALKDAQRQAQRVERGVDLLVDRARAAIARGDYPAADKLLDQAESLDARDRDVQQARAALEKAQQAPDRHRDDRNGPGRR